MQDAQIEGIVPISTVVKGFEKVRSKESKGGGQYAISNSPQWYVTKR